MDNVPKGHVCPLHGPSVHAVPMSVLHVLGSHPWPPLQCPGREGLSLSPRKCLHRRKGWGTALSQPCFRPPTLRHSLAMGMAPAHDRSLSLEQSTKTPSAKPCSSHSRASVSPANYMPELIKRAALDNIKCIW